MPSRDASRIRLLLLGQQPHLDVILGETLLARTVPVSSGMAASATPARQGTSVLRHRPLFDRPQRLTGHAVEHVEEARLAGVRDRVDAPPVVPDGDELRRRHVVQVPQVVMDRLKVPEPLARSRIEREQAVAEQIRSVAVGTVEVVRRRAGRQVHDAALFVDRHLAPVVRAAHVLVRILRPGLVAELTGSRHGVELPQPLAGDDVVGADVTGRRDPGFARSPIRG